MSPLPLRLIETEADWSAAAEMRVPLSTLISLSNLQQDPPWRKIWETALFVSGALYRPGFRLFRNGGNPLLERRWKDWQAEIVIRSHGQVVRGVTVPVTVEIHLANKLLTDVRARYWRKMWPGPAYVGNRNLGTLISRSAVGAVFDLAHPDAAELLCTVIADQGLYWIDVTSSPDAWDAENSYPIDVQTSLELLLAYHGWGRAGRFLHETLSEDPAMEAAVQREYALIERGKLACTVSSKSVSDGMIHNLAVIASTYQLL